MAGELRFSSALGIFTDTPRHRFIPASCLLLSQPFSSCWWRWGFFPSLPPSPFLLLVGSECYFYIFLDFLGEGLGCLVKLCVCGIPDMRLGWKEADARRAAPLCHRLDLEAKLKMACF